MTNETKCHDVHYQIEYPGVKGSVESCSDIDPANPDHAKFLHDLLDEWIKAKRQGDGADHLTIYRTPPEYWKT